MSQIGRVRIHSLYSETSGTAESYPLRPGDQTILMEVDAGAIESLFVHHFQTDQLLVVQGSLVLVVLQNRRYEYIALNAHTPTIVELPPGIPYGVINLSDDSCLVLNSVLRHGPAHENDYRPLLPPFPYDIARVLQLLQETRGVQDHRPLLRAV